MAVPGVYLDECVDYHLVAALRGRGFVAGSALDEGMTQLDDEAQLVYATARDWLLLSHNERDFRRLHQQWQRRGQDHSGIILVPRRPSFAQLELRAAMLLDWVATFDTCRSSLFKWGQLQERLEQGYRLAGYSEMAVLLALGRR